MPITQQGSVNTTALVVPDLYINIVPPAQQNLNGVPTNVVGIVGTAPWGPVNSPVTAGNEAQAAAVFGPRQARKYDLLTPLAITALQGANNFRLVRVTDGTDTAASATVQSNCLTLSSKYTGSLGNQTSVIVSAGTKTGTFKVIVSLPGLVPEAFDNIGTGLSGNPLWVAIAAAINAGTNVLRGPSQIITATAGAGTSAAASQTYTLAGGADGAGGVAGANLIGNDGTTRSGMYALRNTGASVALLSDCDDSTTWSTQSAYGLSEGTYMIATGPAGDTIVNASTTKASVGLDSYSIRLMFGDWCYFLDSVNNVLRLVSPQGFIAGVLAASTPAQSALNSPLQGLAGTQKSNASQQYSEADLQNLAIAGIDVIANPSPGGQYFSSRIGHNTSSNPLVNGDNYTRMTNYIAATLNAGLGGFVGQLQSASVRNDARATLGHYFDGLQSAGLIGDPDNPNLPAYSVVLDGTNNPPARVSLGYMQADVQVQYLAVIEKFLVNVQGGTSVQIARQSTIGAA